MMGIVSYFILSNEGYFEGRIILHTHSTIQTVAKELKLTEKEVEDSLRESKEILYKERKKRQPPLRDEKILTSWNGLMISALQVKYLELVVDVHGI